VQRAIDDFRALVGKNSAARRRRKSAHHDSIFPDSVQ
jgi:hypothetical protein